MGSMDREWRDWLRSLGPSRPEGADLHQELTPEGIEYLLRIASDGTLKAALDEIGASEPDLAG